MDKMKRVQVRLQPDLLACIDETANILRKSRAQIIREACTMSLKDYNSHLRFVSEEDGRALVGKIGQIYSTLQTINLEFHRIGVNLNQVAKQLNASGVLLSSEKTRFLENIDAVEVALMQFMQVKKEMEVALWSLE